MNLQELEEMVKSSESEKLEFKRSTGQRTEAAKTVCAMLNGAGGFLLFGVDDKGNIIGQQVSGRTQESIANEFSRIEPPAFPDIEVIAIKEGLQAVVIHVPGGGGPYIYDGRPYIRQGATTRIMPQQRYERLLLERMHGANRWENQPAQGVTIEDLDKAEILRTVEEAIRRQRLNEPGTRDLEELLTGLNLIKNGKLLNAAVVLFGKSECFLPCYPQCTIRMARFKGKDKTEFIDNKQETGNAFELFKQAQIFFRTHLPVAGKILPNSFERVDEPLYPTEALREAIANALCHRDYSIFGGSISVAIYDDRLEISSAGELHFGLKPEDLYKPHPSYLWNPIIARVFYRRGIIETWGRGTLKIKELTDAANLPAPEFENRMGEFIIRFFSPESNDNSHELGTDLGTDFVPSLYQVYTRLNLKKNDIKELLLLCHEPANINVLAGKFSVKNRTRFRNRYITPLIEEGFIEMTLPDKPRSGKQKYVSTFKGKEFLKKLIETEGMQGKS